LSIEKVPKGKKKKNVFLRLKLKSDLRKMEILERFENNQVTEKVDFFEHAKAFIEKMRNAGRSKKSCMNYEVSVNNLAKFIGRNTNLDCNEVTAVFRKRYFDWMVKSRLGARGQELYLVSIRAIFEDALSTFNDYETGKISIRTNPFRNFTIPKPKPVFSAEKKALSGDVLRKIFTAPVSTLREELAKDVFLLSFCLCGMNAVDLYMCEKIKDMQLIYFRRKTKDRRNDDAEMRINIPTESISIFNKYRPSIKRRHVFSFAERYADSDNFTRAVNKGLKSISKKLGLDEEITLYYARHSWATIAVNDVYLPDGLVDECLVHAPVCKMLRRYVKRDWSRIDRANRKVLDYVFYGKTPPEGSVSV
jgi:integrase